MVDRVNLADPDAEPTDAQLAGLSARAFAGVRRAHELAMERIRAEIATARQSVLADLAKRRSEARAAR